MYAVMAAAGMGFSSAAHRYDQMRAEMRCKEAADKHMATLLRPGGSIYVNNHDDVMVIEPLMAHSCSYCDGQTDAPDYELGCSGCGAHEWKLA